MYDELEKELRAAIDAVLSSTSKKKLVVAGPGTGKTFLFRRLLETIGASGEPRLVLTFINNLKDDLDRDLGELSQVYTFHGYCRRLLHQSENLRAPLTDDFRYFPPLPSLVAADWEILFEEQAPHFIALMRELNDGEETEFYLSRANYYDAVSFDDSVFRVLQGFQADAEEIEEHQLLLVDEYQDFNWLEVEFIRHLATVSPTVIAGDDDQALYSRLRSAQAKYIRDLFRGGESDHFDLPFCMRCTAPIVEAVADVIHHAYRIGALNGRIEKPYRFYPPKKAADSERYPSIRVVETTVQRLGAANYFGRYIEQQTKRIPENEIREAEDGYFPTVLVIGPSQYLLQIRRHLEDVGYTCQVSEGEVATELRRHDGLRILQGDANANLGWRIVLEVDQPEFLADAIKQAVGNERPLGELVADDYREQITAQARAFTEEVAVAEEANEEEHDAPRLTIKLTSYEGSKGLSAQHVFVVGLHNGDLPRDPENVSDLEICKFLVALTRTRKQCHLIYTQRWGGDRKEPSRFLGWLNRRYVDRLTVNRDYWE